MQRSMNQPHLSHQTTQRPSGLLVVDDHELLRLGLRTLVESHAAASGQPVQVFEARGLQEALDVYGEHAAEIALVLLDLHLPDAHGLSGLARFLAQHPNAHVVVLSGVSDPALVREALACGASAYLTKSGDLQDVVQYIASLGLLHLPTAAEPAQASPTIETSWSGNRFANLSTAPSSRVLRTAAGEPVQLSNRQAQMLDWILVGQSNRQIADTAHITEGTVKNHVSALLLLFDVRSRAQLISLLR